MSIDKIRNEKLQYNNNREVATISAISSGTIDKWISYRWRNIPPDQSWIKEQDKFTYSPSWKILEKQTQIIEDAAEKQTKAIEGRVKRQVLCTDKNSIISLFSKIFYLKKLYVN